jgi:hydrogenase nickel incorporation protein HypB
MLYVHDHDHAPDAKNDRLAAENRRAVGAGRIAVVNMIGSPGAGKTTLLEATIRRLNGEIPLAVLEGDQATDRDARRIERAGARVVQINTGAGCHLDASMVAAGLRAVEPSTPRLVLVENVGNLLCPALFDLGERSKIVVMSVAEGDDKPLKYPYVFRAASLLVITKTDLLPYVDFDVERCIAHARSVRPRLEVMRVSPRRTDGVDDVEPFCAFLRHEVAHAQAAS